MLDFIIGRINPDALAYEVRVTRILVLICSVGTLFSSVSTAIHSRQVAELRLLVDSLAAGRCAK